MRDSSSWHQDVSRELRRAWGELPSEVSGFKPAQLCEVELLLRLLEVLVPAEPPGGAYTLLGGYPFARAAGCLLTPEHEVMVTAARMLCWRLRRRRSWQQAMETYRRVPQRLRGYQLPDYGTPAVSLPVSIAGSRIAVYDEALSRLPGHARGGLKTAPPGRSSFLDRRRVTSVSVPPELCFDAAPGHDLSATSAARAEPLTLSHAMLAETAAWMDSRERELGVERPGSWAARLAEIRFESRTADGRRFEASEALHVDGLMHLVGMVGAGKSTLMTLVAAWAARNGLRITLVVGDVAEQLRLAAVLGEVGLEAVPVLGLSTRETHVARLHRRLAGRGFGNLLLHDDAGFDHISTVCVLDGLRAAEVGEPLRYADAPCSALYPDKPVRSAETVREPLVGEYLAGARQTRRIRATDPDRLRGERYGCPVWARCPRHSASRALVGAPIWVANPASLVQSPVPRQLNEERLRYFELACLRSDIIVVDEADAVQMKLDALFAPVATLVEPGPNSWLDQLHAKKIEELSIRGRLPLADQDLDRWNTCLTFVSAATDRLYRILIDQKDKQLGRWIEIDYFSPWTLQEKLLAGWFGDHGERPGEGVDTEQRLYEAYEDDEEQPDVSPALDISRQRIAAVLDAFRDDPLGGPAAPDSEVTTCVDIARDLLRTLDHAASHDGLQDLLRRMLAGLDLPLDDMDWMRQNCRRVEFMMLLSVLAWHLEQLTYVWPQVEAALKLDATAYDLSRRPPVDYAPLVPEAPMGNVLGFRFRPDDRALDEDGRSSGTLSFFRCAGIGRELLLGISEVGADRAAGRRGPHVILMSGTSWAGSSTRAHVLAPVDAVLRPSAETLEAVGRTSFATRFLYDDEGRPMRLSGTAPKDRPTVARALALRLGRDLGAAASPLDQEIAMAEPNRKRALLLVGSYAEAVVVAEALHSLPRWKGRTRVLVSDDTEVDAADIDLDPAEAERPPVVRRGDLARFAEDRLAEVLVAPLMAVERGHNILNTAHQAAFGTALFLARPHPRPDDLMLSIFAVNDWACRYVRDLGRSDDRLGPATFSELVANAGTLDQAGQELRREARTEWRRLLSRRYTYTRLTPWERRAFAWDQLVALWQVIGRLVRGGVPARVVFVDAAFAPRLADTCANGGAPRSVPDGLLGALRTILAPYFDPAANQEHFTDPADPAIAQLLYAPFYRALLDIDHR